MSNDTNQPRTICVQGWASSRGCCCPSPRRLTLTVRGCLVRGIGLKGGGQPSDIPQHPRRMSPIPRRSQAHPEAHTLARPVLTCKCRSERIGQRTVGGPARVYEFDATLKVGHRASKKLPALTGADPPVACDPYAQAKPYCTAIALTMSSASSQLSAMDNGYMGGRLC